MKCIITILILSMVTGFTAFSQVGINADNSAPHGSAILDVKSTSKGVLLPRMTFDQRSTISAPAEGMMVFCTNCMANGSLTYYSNGGWRILTVCSTPSPVAVTPTVIPGQVTWNWAAVPGASGYKWNTTQNYSSALDLGTTTSKTETGISCGITYTRYVWAYGDCGISPQLVLTHSVYPTPAATPTAAAHTATAKSIIWAWNPVPGATGYKWSTTNDLGSAIDNGPSNTKIENGLNCNTEYTCNVWAYNGCGTSAMASFVHATNICTPCGDTVTVTHLASGGTAPVDKTVVYGTANNIAGEPAKCWITKNLGATRQADSVSDAADAAAGWYFQFNRKEGYEYNGTRIPASPWTNNISETSDWLTSNDPCSIELGNSWRLPSYTEFYNIMTAGNWYGDWNLPYLSALKLHAAGSLDKNSGLLHLRGVGGVYWSSNENDNSMAWTMGFFNMGSGMSTGYKAEASSVRCIRDF